MLRSPCMRHARVLFPMGAGILLASVACSSMGTTADFSPGGNSPDRKSDSGSGSVAPSATNSGPTATGVLLVHAAGFPSFRLCFEHFPDQAPQPDENVMPEANVVGVEVGSLV